MILMYKAHINTFRFTFYSSFSVVNQFMMFLKDPLIPLNHHFCNIEEEKSNSSVWFCLFFIRFGLCSAEISLKNAHVKCSW